MALAYGRGVHYCTVHVCPSRLREDGHLVLGFGEEKTPVAFVSSCDVFLYTCALLKGSGGNKEVQQVAAAAKAKKKKTQVVEVVKASPKRSNSGTHSVLQMMLELAFNQGREDEGEWVNLSAIAMNVRVINPQFTYKEYGYSSMSKLLLSMPDKYEVKMMSTGVKVARAKSTKR
jgi:hypothetical protein